MLPDQNKFFEMGPVIAAEIQSAFDELKRLNGEIQKRADAIDRKKRFLGDTLISSAAFSEALRLIIERQRTTVEQANLCNVRLDKLKEHLERGGQR